MAISGAASKVAKKFQNSKINQKLTKKLEDVTSSLKSKTKNITTNIAKKTKEATQKAVNTVSDKAKTIANKTLNGTKTVKNAISNGIKNAPKSEKNKVGSVIDSLGEGILNVQNAFAPSYEFAGVGAFKVTKNGFGESGEETLSQALSKDVQKLKNMFFSQGKERVSTAYTGGKTQAELDDLARDPSHGFKIEEQGLKEREIDLALEERGDLGKIVRDMQIDKGAEFIDETTGIKWDVKSFESYPIGANGVPIKNPRKGAFTVQQGLKKIQKEFKNGNCVIIDTQKLVLEHIEQLKKAIEEAGIADRIIWYP